MITNLDPIKKNKDSSLGKLRSYSEVVEYLDALAQIDYNDQVLVRMKQLDSHFDNVSSKVDTILVGGTNGKSSTIHFAAKLLQTEGFKVGTAYSSHFLAYNE